MSNPNPPSGGENQNPAPQPPEQPQPYMPQPQPQPQYQPPPPQYQQPPYAPPQQPQMQPHMQMQPQQPAPAPAAPPRQMPQVNLASVNQLVTSAPQLVRVLRWIAWAELGVIVLFAIISFCSTFGYYGSFSSLGISAFSSLLVNVLQACVFWGLLMGLALLLEKQSGGKSL